MTITGKHTVSMLVAAALGGTSLLATAQPGRFMLERMDEDGDGRISMEEFSPRREGRLLERADADGDGAVTRDEAQRMMQERQREAEERMNSMFSELDSNEDQALDAGELRAGQFQRLDANADGFIDEEELSAMMSRRGHGRGDTAGRKARPAEGPGGAD